jgi:hypothetical protein
MTVKELVEKLMMCDETAEVLLLSNFDIVKLRSVEEMHGVSKFSTGIKLIDDSKKGIVLLN